MRQSTMRGIVLTRGSRGFHTTSLLRSKIVGSAEEAVKDVKDGSKLYAPDYSFIFIYFYLFIILEIGWSAASVCAAFPRS
jgi:hypothetical protein